MINDTIKNYKYCIECTWFGNFGWQIKSAYKYINQNLYKTNVFYLKVVMWYHDTFLHVQVNFKKINCQIKINYVNKNWSVVIHFLSLRRYIQVEKLYKTNNGYCIWIQSQMNKLNKTWNSRVASWVLYDSTVLLYLIDQTMRTQISCCQMQPTSLRLHDDVISLCCTENCPDVYGWADRGRLVHCCSS